MHYVDNMISVLRYICSCSITNTSLLSAALLLASL